MGVSVWGSGDRTVEELRPRVGINRTESHSFIFDVDKRREEGTPKTRLAILVKDLERHSENSVLDANYNR